MRPCNQSKYALWKLLKEGNLQKCCTMYMDIGLKWSNSSPKKGNNFGSKLTTTPQYFAHYLVSKVFF